jgi:hypothetical protein
MADEKKVFVKWLRAFNGKPAGYVSEENESDAKYWIAEKWCQRSGPPADKAEKAAPVQK